MYVKTITSEIDPNITKSFIDSSLARGIRNDYINDRAFFNIWICINPDEVDILDFGKQEYLKMFPPKISEKRTEYNQKVSQFIEKNRAMIFQKLYSNNILSCMYRLLFENVYLKRNTNKSKFENNEFCLTISLGEAINAIMSMVVNQPEIRKKVNDTFTSIDAIGEILQDSLIDDEKMRRLNLSNLLKTCNVTQLQWESTYDVSRINKVRSFADSNISIDVQNAECDINTLIDKNNKTFPWIFGTIICDKDLLNHLYETYNIINRVSPSDICLYGNDVCISFATKLVGYDNENGIRDIICRTYGITRD